MSDRRLELRDGGASVQSPHDLRSALELSMLKPGDELRVGGRILLIEARACLVADAFSRVWVEFAASDHVSLASARVGDLVCVAGKVQVTPDGPRLAEACLLEHRAVGSSWDHDAGARRLLEKGSRLRERARAIQVIRNYFDQRGFLEVDTPTRTLYPGTERYIEPVGSEDRFLITSPEAHMKRLLVGGFPKIYQLAHCFRREEWGHLHQPEFTMVEWYRAFADWTEVLADTETLICEVATRLRGTPTLTFRGQSVEARRPFERITVREAFNRYAGVPDACELAATDEQRFFELLVSRVEPALAQCAGPVVLHDFPVTLGALARPSPADPTVVERFEIYAAGVELCNGFGELTDAQAQRERFASDVQQRAANAQRTIPVDTDLLQALESGMPRSAGNALGLDRLLLLTTGAAELGDVQAFPEEPA